MPVPLHLILAELRNPDTHASWRGFLPSSRKAAMRINLCYHSHIHVNNSGQHISIELRLEYGMYRTLLHLRRTTHLGDRDPPRTYLRLVSALVLSQNPTAHHPLTPPLHFVQHSFHQWCIVPSNVVEARIHARLRPSAPDCHAYLGYHIACECVLVKISCSRMVDRMRTHGFDFSGGGVRLALQHNLLWE